MKSVITSFLLVFFSWIFLAGPLPASEAAANSPDKSGDRLALIIGNGAYKSGPLKNPTNDALDMTELLRRFGFKVIHRQNIGAREMERSIREFKKQLKEAKVGLFYFSGHGMSVGGRNFLIPIDAEIYDETDVKYESVDAGRVLDAMRMAGTELNLVILDACRDNPFAKSFRTAQQGLARMDAPTGTIIAYATSPGSIAADGEGRNGVYTGSLLRHLPKPDLKIEDVLKQVRKDVIAVTNSKQIPWESTSLTGDFFLAHSLSSPLESVAQAPVAGPSSSAKTVGANNRELEALFWESVKDSTDPDMLQSYLNQFPQGLFAPLAKIKIAKLQSASGPDTKPASKPAAQPTPQKAEPKPLERTATLNVNADTPGALVYLDDRKVGIIPVQNFHVLPGAHTVRVEKGGYLKHEQEIRVAQGGSVFLEISMNKAEASPGRLRVNTDPGDARVRILNLDTPFFQDMPLKAGHYHVQVSAKGYETQNKWIKLGTGEDKALSVRLRSEPAKPAMQTARLTEEEPKTRSKASASKQDYKLAVFPVTLGRDADVINYFIKTAIRDSVTDFVEKSKRRPRPVLTDLIEKRMDPPLWSDKDLNTSQVISLGRKLGFDAVLVHYVSFDEGQGLVNGWGVDFHRPNIRVCLVDVHNKKIYAKKDTLTNSRDQLGIELGRMSKSLIRQYEDTLRY